MTGADLLEAVVRLCAGPADDPRLTRATTVAELVELLWASSGAVASKLGKLADAGLVWRGPPARVVRGQVVQVRRTGSATQVYAPTDRGRQVDATLARITAKRGGRFAPWARSGITQTESLALR